MSITLITGVPGSGKTLYAIGNLLKQYIGATVPQEVDGVTTIHPRTIYSNINGLLLDHELIDAGDNQGLRDWHTWAKPGSVICYDEFQKAWPPRPNGSKVPDDIQALDTHRHMGVDFILITQNCMNVDRHILGLVDRHLHVRRVANMGMAVVYEWDHASKSLLYKNALTKAPWRYDKSVFKLYKSAEVHTKQKRKLPGLVWFILAGLAGTAYAVPNLKARLTERISGKPAPSASAPDQPKPGQKMEYSKDGIKYTVETTKAPFSPLVAVAPVASASAPSAAPVMAGCVATPVKCACVDAAGAPIAAEPDFCRAQILGNAAPGQKVNTLELVKAPDMADIPKDADRQAVDVSVLAFMSRNASRPHRYP
ncbi:zonular occludens toxin domain-containing protein [Rhodoferax ferrireducens]|uniref:zonular occludens toxin domain-containing protein n=1 Tax=Rhodoferax ferrireducens TaxID=192843 RepID=UPI000E0D7033|nr:zonular occludens toxin domain-containing protein [Rhodoferax ferrireducens]